MAKNCFFCSSVGKKFIMAVTGCCLVLFLTFHLCMNLVVCFSATAYNAVCEFLGTNWYALLGTAGLAALAVLHIIYAFILTIQNRKARGGDRYAVTERPKTVEWASQNMLVLGLVVLAGLVLHLFNFWYHMMYAELAEVELQFAPTDGAAWVKYYLGQWPVAIAYIVWLVALWFHLTHGFWSMLQTLGWNNKTWENRWTCVANVFATIVCALFAIIVLGFAIGLFPLCNC